MKRRKPSINKKSPLGDVAKPTGKLSSFRTIGAFILGLVTPVTGIINALPNLPASFQAIEKAPPAYAHMQDSLSAWFNEEDVWKGHWDEEPDGIVDLPDMMLTSFGASIDILEIKRGQLNGTIYTPQLRRVMPFDFALLEGRLDRADRAEVTAFDIFQGHRKNIATLRIVRDGNLMVVTPLDDPLELFPKVLRIARTPEAIAATQSPSSAPTAGK